MAIEIAESVLKHRVGRVSGNTGIFFFLGLIDSSIALEHFTQKDYSKVADYVDEISYESRRLTYVLYAARYRRLELSSHQKPVRQRKHSNPHEKL